jgi:hypothetical protein
MKWKLEFPRFFVPIPDVARYLRQAGVPVCRRGIQVVGQWHARRPEALGTDWLPVTAAYGATWDGFYLGYELTADVPAGLYGRTRLAESDLQGPHLRYTDDRLEAAARRSVPLPALIEQLRRPENRVPADYGCITPGGECLTFSAPLKALMFRGAEAHGPLLARLDDPEIRNEVVLALGAVGDEATVPELIARYPRGPLLPAERAGGLTRACFSYALCWLTGQAVDRSRCGTDRDERNAEKWESWWAANRETFRVSPVKPNATWVPKYPLLTDEHVARIRSLFADRGYQGLECE